MIRFKYVLLTALLILAAVTMVTAQETTEGGFRREAQSVKAPCEYKGKSHEHRAMAWHDEIVAKTDREDWGKCQTCWDGKWITAFVQEKKYCTGKY